MIKTKSGKIISYDEDRDLLLVEKENGGTCIVFDLSTDKVYVQAQGDIELNSRQKIKLNAAEGIEIKTQGEAIIQGKMIRLN